MQRFLKRKVSVLAAAVLFFVAQAALADDLVIQDQAFSDTQLFDSPEGTIFERVVMTPTADVTAHSTYEVVLKPGTRIENGAQFTARMRDVDGLPNRCEIQYFGSLDATNDPSGDYDGDQLTNLQECQLGYNPNENNPDNDGDGLPDAWELQYFGLDLSNDRNGDADGDGISNWIEYKLGTDPTAASEKGPGIYYQYDELGRIRKIERIPSK